MDFDLESAKQSAIEDWKIDIEREQEAPEEDPPSQLNGEDTEQTESERNAVKGPTMRADEQELASSNLEDI